VGENRWRCVVSDLPHRPVRQCDFCGMVEIRSPGLHDHIDPSGHFSTNIRLICENMGSVSHEVTICIRCKATLMTDFQRWVGDKMKYKRQGGSGGN